MKNLKSILGGAVAGFVSFMTAGALAIVLFSSTIGDVNFPGLTPTTIDNMVIGGTTPVAATFTTATATGLATVGSAKIDTGTKTAAATAGAATLAKAAGVITSESITTAAGATYTLTLTNTTVAAADQVVASVSLGTSTTGMPAVTTVAPAAGSVVIVVQNIHASAAFNGTIKIAYAVLKN